MKVKIYTTPSCPYCQMAKMFFKKHQVEYEEIDVSSSEKGLEEMQAKSHQLGVPVIDIDGQIIVGFDRMAIAQILGIKD